MAEAARATGFWARLAEGAAWRRLGLAAASGAAMAIAHEPIPAPWVLVLLCLTVAFRAVGALTTRQSAWFGWAFGVGYFAVALRWIVEPFLVDPLKHGWMIPFAVIGMCGGLALFWAVAFWAARRLAPGDGGLVFVALPVTFALAELARAHILSGFPWALLSYTIVGTPSDYLLAWIGPHGTSTVLLGLGGVIALGLSRGRTLIWPGLVAVPVGVVGLALVTPAAPGADDDAPMVRLVQPNAPQHLKWDVAWMPVFFDRALALTAEGVPPDVVVWPETSIPALLDFAEPWIAAMARAGRGAEIVAGIQRRGEGEAYHNSLVVISPEAEVTGVYDKAHLVPFGEYVPLSWIFEPLGLTGVAELARGFTAGRDPDLVDVPGLGRVRALICYEGIFPEEIDLGTGRPELLMVLTNDAWFGDHAGPRQHLVQAQARAIEQGLPVIRAANTGISAVIDARGRITASLPLGETGYLDARIPGALPPPLYARIGDAPLLLALAFCVGALLLARRRFRIDADEVAG